MKFTFKRFTAAALAAVMIISGSSVTALAAEEDTNTVEAVVMETEAPAPEKSFEETAAEEAIAEEAIDAEAVDAEAVDAEAVDAEAADEEAVDAEAADEEAVDAEAVDAEAVDAETVDAEAVDAEAVDAEAIETVDAAPETAAVGTAALSTAALQAPSQEAKEVAKYGKALYDAAVEGMAISNPAMKPFVPILKALGGEFFNVKDNTETEHFNELKGMLKDIRDQITECNENLEDRLYNAIALDNINDEYGALYSHADVIDSRIISILGNDKYSDEEKTLELAKLYDFATFGALETALSGATKCFYEEVSLFGKCNIFDAAYNRACQEVMFSREAIDLTVPYLTQQLSLYFEAYDLLDVVYGAYEKVHGKNSLLGEREKEMNRLYGLNLDGEKVCSSVMDLYQNYFKRNNYIFVGQSNRVNLKLDRDIKVPAKGEFADDCVRNDSRWSYWERTPEYMQKNPMSAAQIEQLASYCAKRDVTLFEFLFNEMQFRPVIYSISESAGIPNLIPFYMEIVDGTFRYKPIHTLSSGEIYLAAGNTINKDQRGESAWLDFNGVKATKKNASKETIRLADAWLSAASTFLSVSYYHCTPMFFQAGR